MASLTSSSSILIFGATGNIGKHITSAILNANPAFPKVSIFTSPATAKAKDLTSSASWAKTATVITGDVTKKEDVLPALQGADTVISCLGRGALMLQIQLMDWAANDAHVKWFFPSEYGTDIEYDASSAAEKPHQMKLAVRRHAREKSTAGREMRVTYLVTGPYIDMYLAFAPGAKDAGGWDAKAKESVLLGNGKGKVGFCTMRDVGKLLVASLRHPEASVDRVLKVQSFIATPNEIQAEFERQAKGSNNGDGGSAWKVSYTSLAVLKEREAEAWEKGSNIATLCTLRRIWTEGRTLYDKTDNESIGLGPGDMDSLEWAVAQAVSGS